MNFSQLLSESLADAKVGFAIAAVLGYCLYRIMTITNRKKLDSSNDTVDSSNDIVSEIKLFAQRFVTRQTSVMLTFLLFQLDLHR